MTEAADAALQTWTVSQNFGYNNAAGTNGADLALSATFNTAFKVNFFNTGTVNQTNQETANQVLWAPNNNLSFINWGTAGSVGANDPAQWRGSQTFGANALNGVASVFGASYTVHSWFQAANSHATRNDIAWSTFGNTPQGALAIGIRFDAGGRQLPLRLGGDLQRRERRLFGRTLGGRDHREHRGFLRTVWFQRRPRSDGSDRTGPRGRRRPTVTETIGLIPPPDPGR